MPTTVITTSKIAKLKAEKAQQISNQKKKIFCNKKQSWKKDILKLFIATAIFYIGIFNFTKEVGEKTIYLAESGNIPKASTFVNVLEGSEEKETKTQNKKDTDIKTQLKAQLEHRAAQEKLALLQNIKKQKVDPYEKKLKTFCRENKNYCGLIDFNGMGVLKKQYIYLNMVKVIEEFMMEHQKFGKPILGVLKEINILDKKWSPRAYASWSKITLHGQSIRSYKEFFNLIGHEIGHVVDLGSIQGSSRIKDKNFTEFGKSVFPVNDPSLEYYALSWVDEETRKEDMNKLMFCSKYWMSNPFEDFAECHNLYLNHNKLFFAIAKEYPLLKKKFNFFANLYDGNYIFWDEINLAKLEKNIEWRVWDSTKLDG